MSDDFIPYWRLVALADDQLQWGKEPDTMEAMAHALVKRQPASVVAESLLERAAYLRTMSNRVPRHGASTTGAMQHLL